jgi:hypothetical protein
MFQIVIRRASGPQSVFFSPRRTESDMRQGCREDPTRMSQKRAASLYINLAVNKTLQAGGFQPNGIQG